MIGDMVDIRISVSTYAYADHVLNGHHSDTGVSVNRRRRLALDILRLLLFIFMLLLAPQERHGLKKSDEKYLWWVQYMSHRYATGVLVGMICGRVAWAKTECSSCPAGNNY